MQVAAGALSTWLSHRCRPIGYPPPMCSSSTSTAQDLRLLGRVLAELRRRPDTWVRLTLLPRGLRVDVTWPGEESAEVFIGEPAQMLDRLVMTARHHGIRVHRRGSQLH